MTRITEQLGRLQRRIQAATALAGRESDAVEILAISKKHPVSAIREAQSAGLRQFGENYVQEAISKIEQLESAELAWHFVGSIQSNKTRAIAEKFDWVHTLSSSRIAERLSDQRPEQAADLQALIQIAPSGADTRGGIAAELAPALAATIARLPRIRLRGLMIMPLPGLQESQLRQEFARAHTVLDQLRHEHPEADTLSMGMSADLEAAIMEGSTMVRIGTDLFGPRGG